MKKSKKEKKAEKQNTNMPRELTKVDIALWMD